MCSSGTALVGSVLCVYPGVFENPHVSYCNSLRSIDRVSLRSPGWASTQQSPSLAFSSAGVAGVCHHAPVSLFLLETEAQLVSELPETLPPKSQDKHCCEGSSFPQTKSRPEASQM